MEKQERQCPKCGAEKRQWNIGLTRAGSQRCRCGVCKRDYIPSPKRWAYTEQERKQALRLIADGNTGRGIGRQMNMSKANAYRWAREDAKKGNL